MDYSFRLSVIKFEALPGKGRDVLAIYNAHLEGETTDGKPPMIRGIRLFQSTRETNRKYIRLPQIHLPNGRSYNVFTLPSEVFRKLETMIIDHYEKYHSETADEEEIDLSSFTF